MKSYVITINEIDDVNDAVELLRKKMGRLGLPGKLKKTTFGIISTHADAIHSGVYKAVCDELPFETAGFATDSQSPDGETGIYLLSVLILTSDECEFSSGCTDIFGDSNAKDTETLVQNCYNGLKQKLSSEPKLCLFYAPHHTEHFPGDYLHAITQIDSHTPIFGAVSTDIENLTNISRDGVFALHNGKALKDNVAMVLISGNIKPQFFISSFTEDAVQMRNAGTITKCTRNIIEEIDNMPAVEFLKQIGFFGLNNDEVKIDAGTATATFILDYGQKFDISRAFTDFTETGGVFCMGLVRENAKISFAISEPAAVTETTHEVVDKVLDNGAKTVIFYSCVGRRLGLLNNPMAEFDILKSKLSVPNDINAVTYIASHCGGEISPFMMPDENGKEVVFNCEHNQTLVACAF
jgi:hypothetical protein